MSREYISSTLDYSVQANFTAFINGVHQAILNRGWLQTTDTGQCDPATVVVPASGAYAGYVNYKTNDGVGDIFYLRLRFGRSGSVRSCKFDVSVGTGTDGAGNLTGNTTGVHTVLAIGDPGAVAVRTIIAGDAGRLVVLNATDGWITGLMQFGFAISRTVDAAGVANARGMEIFTMINNAGVHADNLHYQQFLPAASYSSVIPITTQTRGPVIFVDREWSQGVKTYFSLTQTVSALDSNYPTPFVVNYWGGTHKDFAANGTYRLSTYGTEREYFIMNNDYPAALTAANVIWAICIS